MAPLHSMLQNKGSRDPEARLTYSHCKDPPSLAFSSLQVLTLPPGSSSLLLLRVPVPIIQGRGIGKAMRGEGKGGG